MRVWLLDPSAKTPYYNLYLTAALRDRNIDTRLVTSRFIHEDNITNADTLSDYFFFRSLHRWSPFLKKHQRLRWGLRLITYMSGLGRFWWAFRHHTPDILHIQWTLIPRFDQILFRQLARRVPLVVTIHNPLIKESAVAHLDDMTPFIPFAARVIVHAEQNRTALLDRLEIAPDKIRIVPHGPLFGDYPEVPAAEARQHLNIAASAPTILFFGVIKPYKGLHDLIEALALVHRSVPNARLIVAGSPQEPIASYQQALIDNGLASHTQLHIGFIASQDVPKYFAASDIVCLPYREASQSGVLLSAYRFGKAVVVTDAGALPQTVEHGQNGYVVPIGDRQALADALITLLKDPALREQFGKHSKYLADTRYSWSKAAKLTEVIYEELCP